MTVTDRVGKTARPPETSAQIPQTLNSLLTMRAASASPCLIEDDTTISWAEIAKRTGSVAAGFAALGVKKGDRVAIWLPNRSAWLVSFFACAQLGAIAVSINTRFRSVEVSDLLFRSGAKLLIYWPSYKDIDFAGILAQCASETLDKLETIVLYSAVGTALPQTIAGKPTKAFADLLATPPMRDNHGKPDDPCVIFTTSGTTKAPKLVMHCQRNVLSHGFNAARQYGMNQQSRFILFPPFCGVYGFCSALAALAGESPLIIAPTWDPPLFADLLEKYQATHLTASNDALQQLFDTRGEGRLFPSIAFAGSANLNPALADIAQRAERRGIELVGLYGSSEMQAIFSLSDRNAPIDVRSRAGGIPASDKVKMRARDPETQQICKPGEAGELEFIAPESRFVAYYNDEAATRNAFTDDGYFKTGDLGTVEADGSFVYLARMGDTLRLGGFLVSPAEIEELVQEHPTVESCQIVGVQVNNAVRPIAFVIARKGAAVQENEIIGFTAERLAKYKVPVKVYVVDEFPTTPSANGSKIQKNKLRDMAEARLAGKA